MSETLHNSQEQESSHIETGAEQKAVEQKLHEKAEKAEQFSDKATDQLRVSAKEKAVSGKEVTIGEREAKAPAQHVTRSLKAEAYKKTLKNAQSRLPIVQRSFSKVIHQPAVERISAVGAQTIGRSSAFFGGSLSALLGSILLIVLSKRIGFSYNYLVFFMLFLGGYVVGLILELIIKPIRKKSP